MQIFPVLRRLSSPGWRKKARPSGGWPSFNFRRYRQRIDGSVCPFHQALLGWPSALR
jgi:hypothetical protein